MRINYHHKPELLSSSVGNARNGSISKENDDQLDRLFDRAVDRMQVIILAAEQLRHEIDGLENQGRVSDAKNTNAKESCNSLIDSIVRCATENFRLIDTSIRLNLSKRESRHNDEDLT